MKLSKIKGNKIYIQIITNGLDVVSHKYRGRPPVKYIANSLYNDILGGVVNTLQHLKASSIVYVSADHGILWKPEPESQEHFIHLGKNKITTSRYTKGSHISSFTKEFTMNGSLYSCLKYPYIFKPPSSTEWGIHGGISFQESIVPFLKIEVS